MTSPVQKNEEYGYELAYRLAREQLASIPDLAAQCLHSGARLKTTAQGKIIILDYLNQPYQITLPDIKITAQDSPEEVRTRDRILLLHYLNQSKGTPLTGKTIAYKELPEGSTYFPTFAKRAIHPVVNRFGKEPPKLAETAKALGGQPAEYGDDAVTITAFPRVPVTFILWRGDEEFPPEGNILFDSSIPDYLSIEDINVLCETIAWRLVRMA